MYNTDFEHILVEQLKVFDGKVLLFGQTSAKNLIDILFKISTQFLVEEYTDLTVFFKYCF